MQRPELDASASQKSLAHPVTLHRADCPPRVVTAGRSQRLEKQRKWQHRSKKALHKAVKQAKAFEVGKLLRRLKDAELLESLKAADSKSAAKGKQAAPTGKIPQSGTMDPERIRSQLAAAKEADVEAMTDAAGLHCGFDPSIERLRVSHPKSAQPQPSAAAAAAGPGESAEAAAAAAAELEPCEAGQKTEGRLRAVGVVQARMIKSGCVQKLQVQLLTEFLTLFPRRVSTMGHGAADHGFVQAVTLPALIFASTMALAAAAQAASTLPAALPTLSANLPAAVASGLAQSLGAAAPAQDMKLGLVLPLRNEAELDALLLQIRDPQSASYHHYLSSDEFASRFGATQQDYDAVVAWARNNGLTVARTTPNRRIVDVQGSVATVNRALHVQVGNYQHPTDSRTFFAPDREPTMTLATPLLAIIGLTNVTPPHNHLLRGTSAQHMKAVTRTHGSGPSEGRWGDDADSEAGNDADGEGGGSSEEGSDADAGADADADGASQGAGGRSVHSVLEAVAAAVASSGRPAAASGGPVIVDGSTGVEVGREEADRRDSMYIGVEAGNEGFDSEDFDAEIADAGAGQGAEGALAAGGAGDSAAGRGGAVAGPAVEPKQSLEQIAAAAVAAAVARRAAAKAAAAASGAAAGLNGSSSAGPGGSSSQPQWRLTSDPAERERLKREAKLAAARTKLLKNAGIDIGKFTKAPAPPPSKKRKAAAAAALAAAGSGSATAGGGLAGGVGAAVGVEGASLLLQQQQQHATKRKFEDSDGEEDTPDAPATAVPVEPSVKPKKKRIRVPGSGMLFSQAAAAAAAAAAEASTAEVSAHAVLTPEQEYQQLLSKGSGKPGQLTGKAGKKAKWEAKKAKNHTGQHARRKVFEQMQKEAAQQQQQAQQPPQQQTQQAQQYGSQRQGQQYGQQGQQQQQQYGQQRGQQRQQHSDGRSNSQQHGGRPHPSTDKPYSSKPAHSLSEQQHTTRPAAPAGFSADPSKTHTRNLPPPPQQQQQQHLHQEPAEKLHPSWAAKKQPPLSIPPSSSSGAANASKKIKFGDDGPAAASTQPPGRHSNAHSGKRDAPAPAPANGSRPPPSVSRPLAAMPSQSAGGNYPRGGGGGSGGGGGGGVGKGGRGSSAAPTQTKAGFDTPFLRESEMHPSWQAKRKQVAMVPCAGQEDGV
ncbi:MAG: hypothetical protein WDW38_003995 [Sanguina aurantia]